MPYPSSEPHLLVAHEEGLLEGGRPAVQCKLILYGEDHCAGALCLVIELALLPKKYGTATSLVWVLFIQFPYLLQWFFTFPNTISPASVQNVLSESCRSVSSRSRLIVSTVLWTKSCPLPCLFFRPLFLVICSLRFMTLLRSPFLSHRLPKGTLDSRVDA